MTTDIPPTEDEQTATAGALSGVQRFGVRGMTCASCVRRVERAVAALPGVEFTAASTEMELGGRVYELQGLGDTGRVEIELNAAGDVLEIEYGEDDD